jgi:hypothetical protein
MITADHLGWLILGRVCEYASAIFGILGTVLMARRCGRQIGRSILYALTWPVFLLVGKGGHARKFFIARANMNWNTAESPADMTLGLNLLFWAFFLQLISLILK